MKRRFVPTHYYIEIYIILQTLSQGFRNVDKYYKEMKITIIRDSIYEDKESIMARFINGLNKDIPIMVELQHYMKNEDMTYMAVSL